MNDDNFKNYREAKFVLNKLVCQFYDYSLTKEKADILNIKYTDSDILNTFGNLVCVFHRYEPEGMYLWHKLGLTEPIILIKNIWDFKVDQKEENKDYYKEFLELKLIDLILCMKYYSSKISIEEAYKHNIDYNYNYDLDESDNIVEVCDHFFESAGESAWTLFGFKEPIIPKNKFYELQDSLMEEILYVDNKKIKKYVK